MDYAALEDRYDSGFFPKRQIVIVRGEGATLWDDQGRSYIDCVAGHGVAIVGHCNPAVVRAIGEQSARLITCPQIFYSDVRARLLEKLVGLGGPGFQRAFLCNSGTEAVEACIKLARLATGRVGVVAAMRGFHGRTMGALSATWEPHYREPFVPLVPGFSHVPYDKVEDLAQAVDDNTAAVLLEVVQGEGGVHVGDPAFLRGAQDICRERGAMLIIDEVQTGFGRTGRMFAFQHCDLQPDLVALAKGIAGGVPMGAVLIGERVVPGIKPGLHGTTFGGNALACAASLAAIDYLIDNALVEAAARKGAWMMDRLRGIDARVIRQVRGLGLMIGIDLRQRVTPYLKTLMDEGVLALPAGSTVLRLLPPLVITDDQLEAVACAIERVLAA